MDLNLYHLIALHELANLQAVKVEKELLVLVTGKSDHESPEWQMLKYDLLG